jgi:hypothetical protein
VSTAGFYEPSRAAKTIHPHPGPHPLDLGIEALQQGMDPRRRDRHRRLRRPAPGGHLGEGPPDQPLQAQPESAILPDQHLQLPPVAAEEDEAVTGVRLVPELVLDHAGQGVDAPAHVLGLPGEEDPAHGGEAQHGRPVISSASTTARTA